MSLLVTLVALLPVLTLAVNDSTDKILWDNFKKDHNKIYRSLLEEEHRFSVFQSNLREIETHNAGYRNGTFSYYLKITGFADLTQNEFVLLHLNKAGASNLEYGKIFEPSENAAVPERVDWRDKNIISEVKNQRNCGSCWAFSATGALEAHTAMKQNRNVLLSEQELVDCTMEIFGNYGCRGGNFESAFIYVDMFGISSEASYPYLQKNGECHKGVNAGVNVTNFVRLKRNENNLKVAVGTVGPVSAALNANYLSLYGGGVFDNPACFKSSNHAILVVGYGNENGKDYWLIKNSWGKEFGESGYFKLVRNKDGQCGIGEHGAYPLIG